MKNYEQKYKEAFKRAKFLKENTDGVGALDISACFEQIFPELKESEDERIRQSLIRNFTNQHSSNFPTADGFTREQILTWLEKQGEQKPISSVWKYKKDNTPLLRDSFILNKYGCVAKSPSGALVSDVWVLDFDELAKLPKEEIEQQTFVHYDTCSDEDIAKSKGFIDGAKWADQYPRKCLWDAEKVIKWLMNNYDNIVCFDDANVMSFDDDCIEQLKQAMEE